MTDPLISVIVPTYGRAYKLAGVSANIHAATESPCEVIFSVEPDDTGSQEAVNGLPGDRLHVSTRKATYFGAVNSAFPHIRGRYFFTGADDLRFHPGWDTQVLGVMKDGTLVGGTNDLLNYHVQQGVQSTHIFIDRTYIEDTGGVMGEPPGTVFHEGYWHGYGEAEFCVTAIWRDVFAPCLSSVVEHLHWQAGKSPHDAVYERNDRLGAGDHDLTMERTRFIGDQERYIELAQDRLRKRGVL